jgi:hypothetical protein
MSWRCRRSRSAPRLAAPARAPEKEERGSDERRHVHDEIAQKTGRPLGVVVHAAKVIEAVCDVVRRKEQEQQATDPSPTERDERGDDRERHHPELVPDRRLHVVGLSLPPLDELHDLAVEDRRENDHECGAEERERSTGPKEPDALSARIDGTPDAIRGAGSDEEAKPAKDRRREIPLEIPEAERRKDQPSDDGHDERSSTQPRHASHVVITRHSTIGVRTRAAS